MQARAVFEAAAIVQKQGIKVKPEIMIPLVGFKKELDLQVEVVHRVAKEVQAEQQGEAQLHGRHDDRSAARRADGRRNRADGGVLQLRHQRPDANRPRHVARRLRVVPRDVSGERDLQKEPVRDDRSDRRRPARATSRSRKAAAPGRTSSSAFAANTAAIPTRSSSSRRSVSIMSARRRSACPSRGSRRLKRRFPASGSGRLQPALLSA